jgi:hypothetical protein
LGLPCFNIGAGESGEATRNRIINVIVARYLQGFLAICGVTAVIFLIVGGLQMHVAAGNEEEITKGKKTALWALAGLIISILSVAIVQIIINLPYNNLI